MSSTTSKRLRRVWQLSEDARMAGRSTINVTELEAALTGKPVEIAVLRHEGDTVKFAGISIPSYLLDPHKENQ